jgi:hypothetical protein
MIFEKSWSEADLQLPIVESARRERARLLQVELVLKPGRGKPRPCRGFEQLQGDEQRRRYLAGSGMT